LVHNPSALSGSQRSPAVRRFPGRKCDPGETGPPGRTLIRMRSSGTSVPLHQLVAVFCVGGWDPSTVDVAAPSPAVGLGVGVVAQAASGSRFWRRRRVYRARPWRRPRGGWLGRRRAARRTAPAAPRSAVPGQGRAKSPPIQNIEHEFEAPSTFLRTTTGATPSLYGPPPKRILLAVIPGSGSFARSSSFSSPKRWVRS